MHARLVRLGVGAGGRGAGGVLDPAEEFLELLLVGARERERGGARERGEG